MLIDFTITNYRSFAREQTLSLVATSDQLHPSNLVSAGKQTLLKSIAIFGPNASGKSNLIKGISFMDQFIETSASGSNMGDPIGGVIPFRLDSKYASEPSSFEMSLIIGETRYVYGFSVSPTRVIGEWLDVAAPGGRLSNWVSRHYDHNSQKTNWAIKGPLRKYHDLLSQRTRENGLLLSRAADLNILEVGDLYLWFKKKLRIIDLSNAPFLLDQQTAQRASNDPTFKARALTLIQDADLGIDDFDVRERTVFALPEEASEEIAGLLRSMQGILKKAKVEPYFYRIYTFHHPKRGGNPVAFSLDADESNGTRRFFGLAGPILDALDEGASLVLDEFECSIHPLLARKIVGLFLSPNVNKKGAQLIFATHDSTLMSRDLFRRDQIWLTSKDSGGATELFSLYNIEDRPRNTEAIQKNYLDGRYGGVPQFGPILEDLEIS